MIPRFTLTAMDHTTGLGPLVALGFFIRQQDLLAPIRSRVHFDTPTHSKDPVEALLDMLVGILAGCEVVAQVNTTIRTDPILARAWGREQFFDQSTIARVLQACRPSQVEQMRSASEAIYHWAGRSHRHEFEQGLLRLDIDLTGMPASEGSEGSTKGYFSGKKTSQDASW